MNYLAAQAMDIPAEIERLMQTYQDSLLRMCFVYLNDLSLAEDAVQETFIKAYHRYSDFRGESSEKTWLLRIAINTCNDMRRSRWFRFIDRRVTLEMLPASVCTFEPKDETLIFDVMALPPKMKAVILLFYYQGMSADEISLTLRIAKPTVYQRLNKAQAILKCVLEGGNENE